MNLLRHKLLDVIAGPGAHRLTDYGKVIATYPGHKVNTEMAKLIRKEIKTGSSGTCKYPFIPPVLDTICHPQNASTPLAISNGG